MCLILSNNPKMCRKLLISMIIIVSDISCNCKAELFCYQGWVEDRGKCYRVFHNSNSWNKSMQQCDYMKSKLVTIDDITEQTFILQMISSTNINHWIGYFRNGTNWRWINTVNTSLNHLNVTTIAAGEDCSAITMMGIWDPTECSHHLPYICESEIKDCSTYDGWFAFDTQCLYLTQISASWAEARLNCKSIGGDLSFVKNPYTKGQLLLQNGVTTRTWIGLKYDSNNSKYTWLDKTPFVNLQNKTSFSRHGCGAMTLNETSNEVKINGYPCNTKLQGLCERTIDQEIKTTPSTSSTLNTTISPDTRRTTSIRLPSESFSEFNEPLSSITVGPTRTIQQPEPDTLEHLAECLTNVPVEYVEDCIRDIFMSFEDLCITDYQPYRRKTGRHDLDLYSNTFYKRLVEHFQSFIDNNMTFSLCQQIKLESIWLVEKILDQTYPISNISANESLHFYSEKLELRLKYVLADSTNTGAYPFESQVTGCLVHEIHRTSSTSSADVETIFAVINNEEILEVASDESDQFTHHFIVSPVLIICAFEGGKKTSIGHKYTMTYHTASDIAKEKQLNITQHQVYCSFYDTKRKFWSSSGCEMSKEDEVALSVITYIGCSISMVTMFIALTVFTCIRSLNSERVFVHRNLCIAILCAQVLFLAAGKATRHKMVCRITAVVLHYCFLSIFSWMLVEGLHLYTKVVQVFGTDNSQNTYYLCFGWGLPLVLVVISSIADWDGYGTETSCWLSIDRKTIWAFIGPAIAVIVVNLVILIMVLRVVITSSKTDRNSKKDQMRAAVKAALFLLHLLGLTWIFGLFAVNRRLIVFEYIFAISNSLQGFFVFLFHCALNTEVRQALRRVRERRAILNENINSVSLSTSGSESSSLAVEGTFRFRLSYNGGTRRSILQQRSTFVNATNRKGVEPNTLASGKGYETGNLPCHRHLNNHNLKDTGRDTLPLIYI